MSSVLYICGDYFIHIYIYIYIIKACKVIGLQCDHAAVAVMQSVRPLIKGLIAYLSLN